MKSPPRAVHRLLSMIDGAYDRLQAGCFRAGHWRGRPMITPYLGFGWSHSIYLKGRVLLDRGILPAAEHDPAWRNLLNMYRRLLSQEVPGAQVLARFPGLEVTALAGEEGFFEVRHELPAALPTEPAWRPVDLQLLWPQRTGQPPVTATGQVLIVHPQAQYGVISDIDDTVLVTHATNPLRMGLILLFRNARTRQTYAGVASFYQALQAGADRGKPGGTSPPVGGPVRNPLFYVSSSPWNLYDLLVHFLELHGIPLGPMIALRDWGITQNELLPIDNQAHKLRGIGQILEMLPHLPFLLIGDSGQEDPAIYAEVVRRFPGRILGVYIRAVSRSPAVLEQIRLLGAQIEAQGSTFLLTTETSEMAHHAASQGWIAE